VTGIEGCVVRGIMLRLTFRIFPRLIPVSKAKSKISVRSGAIVGKGNVFVDVFLIFAFLRSIRRTIPSI